MPAPTIWIEEGCIQCGWCQNLEPRVFLVTAQGCEIRGEARIDGLASANRHERKALVADLLDEAGAGFMRFVADGCPVQVIHMTPLVEDGILL